LLITGRYLNHIKATLAQRSAILNNSLKDNTQIVKSENDNLFGDNVIMVRRYTLNSKLLAVTEKDEVVKKYEAGMTLTAIANFYECHYTAVGRFLR
jgi:hypothetical protein